MGNGLQMEKEKAGVSISGKMEANMRAIGRMTKFTGTVVSFMQMVTVTLESS